MHLPRQHSPVLRPTGRRSRVADPVLDETAVLLGRLAVLLGDPRPSLPDVLAELVVGLGLRSAVLRDRAGEGALLAVAGEVVHAVPSMRPPVRALGAPVVELPVPAAGRGEIAALTVVGARPGQLPVLRAVAAVLGLGLAGAGRASAEALVAEASALLLEADEDGDLLADGLHDGPVQALVAARYACDAVVRGADPALARDAVQEALVGLRRSLWHLRPRGADDLPAALAALSARTADAGGPPLELILDTDAAARLARPARGLAFRLVQAVVRDGAGPVRVGLREAGGGVQLVVDGGALARAERWRSRVGAVGGELTTGPDRLRLVLPADPPGPPPPARTARPVTVPSLDPKVCS
jgi:hypothetical protein